MGTSDPIMMLLAKESNVAEGGAARGIQRVLDLGKKWLGEGSNKYLVAGVYIYDGVGRGINLPAKKVSFQHFLDVAMGIHGDSSGVTCTHKWRDTV